MALLALLMVLVPGQALARYEEEYTNKPADADVTPIGLDSPQRVEVANGSEPEWYSFTPAESGMYLFVSSNDNDDPYGALYGPNTDTSYGDDEEYSSYELKLLNTNDDGGNGSNFKILESLNAETIYYIACSSYSNSSTDSYTLKVSKFDQYDLSNYNVSRNSSFRLGRDTVSFENLNVRVYSSGDDDVLTYNTDYTLAGWYKAGEDGAADTALSSIPQANGYYYALLRGKAPYHGELRSYFTIMDPKDVSNWEFSLYNQYAGDAVSAESLKLKAYWNDDDDETMPAKPLLNSGFKVTGWSKREWNRSQGRYVYTALSGAPTTAGTYRVEIAGVGQFTGTTYETFTVNDPTLLSEYRSYRDTNYLWANGSPASLERMGFVLYRYDNSRVVLTKGVDYEVKGWYTYEKQFNGSDEYDYDWVKGSKLAGAPSAAGYYCVEIRGIGSVTGDREISFSIYDPSDISQSGYNLNRNSSVAYTGSPLSLDKLGLKLSRYDESGTETVLSYGTDYRITKWEKYQSGYDDSDGNYVGGGYVAISGPEGCIERGEYRITVEGTGRYTGSDTAYFYIVDGKDLDYADIDGVRSAYYSDGAVSVQPKVTALDGTVLQQGRDYALQFKKYDEASGTYKNVTSVSGPGRYRVVIDEVESSTYYGSSSNSFTVYPNSDRTDIADEYWVGNVDASYAYTGSAITPTPVIRYLRYYEEMLEEGDDYSVSYANNVTGATATVTATGINAFTGALTQNFEITGVPAPAAAPATPAKASTPAAAKKGTKIKSGKATYKVTKSGKSPQVAFTGTKAKGTVKIPASIKKNGVTYKVTSIAAKALKGNKKVTALKGGSNITKIGAKACYNMKKLKSAVAGDKVTSIGGQAFAKCPKLKSFTFGKKVKTVGKKVFNGSKKLKKVTVKSNKLTKASVKNIVKNSKVKNLKLSGKTAKKMKKTYKKAAGKKITVK